MATVPYSPIPSVGATPSAAPRLSQNTADAFGESVARATSHLGQVTEKAGDEIFSRAIALQQLDNEAAARDAEVAYITTMGDKHAEFSSLQGKSAKDAYPAYTKDLEESRAKGGEGLNPMARKIYDSSTMGQMARTIFNGAGHAATQNKRYLAGTSDAKIGALGDQALSQPMDDKVFKTSIEQVKSEVDNLAGINGWSDEQKDQETAKRVSEVWSKRIQGIAKTKPFVAGKMLDDAIKDGSIRGESISPIQNFVRQQQYTVGARGLSGDINSGVYAGEKKVDIRLAASAVGKFESGSRYWITGVDTKYGQALGKYQVMEDFLPDFLKQAGMAPMTRDEYLKNPDAQDELFSKVFGANMDKYGSFNKALMVWFNGKPYDRGFKDAKDTSVPSYVANINVNLARHTKLADRVAQGDEQAEKLAPNDPMFKDYVQQRITSDYNRGQAEKRDTNFQNKQTIEESLMGDKDGKLPTTVEELTEKPENQAAWDALEPSQRRQYLNVLKKNANDDIPQSADTIRRYQELRGMAQTDPAEFLNLNITEEEIPRSDQKSFIGLQQKLKANAAADPRVTRAMQLLRPMLEPAGLATKTQANQKDYYQFVGALQDALTDFQGETKKAPTAEEVSKIGARLLQESATKGWRSWFGSTNRMFQEQVPDETREKVKADVLARTGFVLSDEEVQREYTRQRYNTLYGGTAKAAQPKPAGPQVPQPK